MHNPAHNVIKVPFAVESREAIRTIREDVFINEQQVPPELEFDGLDEAALHVLAYVDARPVATGRVLEDGHIGRIAVLKAFRGQGVGAAVVRELVEQARRSGLKRVYLGAQLHAVTFYESLGFTPYGDEFMDAGIAHIHMDKSI